MGAELEGWRLIGWFPTGCISLLGLQGGGIAESQISASSVRYAVMGLQRWGPELARLHNKGLVNAWSAAAHDRSPWIQVSLQGSGWIFAVLRIEMSVIYI